MRAVAHNPVALAMSVLENTGVMALGHIAVTGSPARTVTRIANLFRLSLTKVTTGPSRLESGLAGLLADPADMSSVGPPSHLVSSVGPPSQSAGTRWMGTRRMTLNGRIR